MFTWGILAAAMMFVRTPFEFYSVRLLLGIAEAGFFPGVLYYLTLLVSSDVRARGQSVASISLSARIGRDGRAAGWLMGSTEIRVGGMAMAIPD